MVININELLEELEDRYKDRLPTGRIDEYNIARLIGQQDVIKYIYQYIDYKEHKDKKVSK